VSLPDFKICYYVKTFPVGQKVLVDTLQSDVLPSRSRWPTHSNCAAQKYLIQNRVCDHVSLNHITKFLCAAQSAHGELWWSAFVNWESTFLLKQLLLWSLLLDLIWPNFTELITVFALYTMCHLCCVAVRPRPRNRFRLRTWAPLPSCSWWV